MIKAKKSLGQNFLTDKTILKKIANITPIKGKTILEVGPGTGNLTSFILKNNPKKVFVIEKDQNLAFNLKNIFKDQLEVINDDILNIDENSIFKENVIVFGNLPYNISTEILSKWILNLNNTFWFDHLVLMFQKEVADRIVARPNTKEFSRLTVLSNWRLDIKKHFDVSKNCFFPRPKVNSTILSFKPKKNNFFHLKNPKNLEKVTQVLFSNRRKMINKNLKRLFKAKLFLLNELNIDLKKRPEELSNETFYKIAMKYETLFD